VIGGDGEGAHSRGDWDRVKRLYAQMVGLLSRGRCDPDVAGDLAKQMARLCAAYDGAEELFVEDLLEVMDEVDPLPGCREEQFEAYYHDDRYRKADKVYEAENERRRPTPFEAAVETCRRLRDVNRLRECLATVPTGCVLGGSTSYGRFFNTVGLQADGRASDIDLLLVVASYDDLPRIVEALRRVEGILGDGLSEMHDRAGSFSDARARLEENARCIFSHKLDLWPSSDQDSMLAGTSIGGSYDLSLHIVSRDDLDYLILNDRPRLDESRTIFDYRAAAAGKCDLQRSFAGLEFDSAPKVIECPGGYVVSSTVCYVRELDDEGERYFPGNFQNLILPEFEIRWDFEPQRMYLPIYSFKVKLEERLAHERRERPYERQRLSNSHTRYLVWAPYVSDRINANL
jgi:hypothetical protein